MPCATPPTGVRRDETPSSWPAKEMERHADVQLYWLECHADAHSVRFFVWSTMPSRARLHHPHHPPRPSSVLTLPSCPATTLLLLHRRRRRPMTTAPLICRPITPTQMPWPQHTRSLPSGRPPTPLPPASTTTRHRTHTRALSPPSTTRAAPPSP
jgi:hypothetical protein